MTFRGSVYLPALASPARGLLSQPDDNMVAAALSIIPYVTRSRGRRGPFSFLFFSCGSLLEVEAFFPEVTKLPPTQEDFSCLLG